MCIIHKWTKWEQYEETGTAIPNRLLFKSDQAIRYVETRQRRTCLRCGKMQDERVR